MEKLVDVIAKLSREIGHIEEAAKDQFEFKELTLTQMNYLETISQLGNPNMTELAADLNLTKPTVKVAIDKLSNHTHDFAHKQMAELINQKLDLTEIGLLEMLLEKVFQKP